jgi:hypothetical protein
MIHDILRTVENSYSFVQEVQLDRPTKDNDFT